MLWRNSRGRPLNAPAAFISPVPRYDCEVSRAASSQFLCLIRNVFPNVCCCFDSYREESGSPSCTTVEREDPCVNQYSEYSRSPLLPRRSQLMLPPHKCETTGLVVEVVPQLAVALKQRNPRHLQAEAPVSFHPRVRFPRQRQRRANVPTPCQRQGWVSPHPRARYPLQGHPPGLNQQGVSKSARIVNERSSETEERGRSKQRPFSFVSKKLDAPYRSGPSRTRIKIKNPKAPAATRAVDGTF